MGAGSGSAAPQSSRLPRRDASLQRTAPHCGALRRAVTRCGGWRRAATRSNGAGAVARFSASPQRPGPCVITPGGRSPPPGLRNPHLTPPPPHTHTPQRPGGPTSGLFSGLLNAGLREGGGREAASISRREADPKNQYIGPQPMRRGGKEAPLSPTVYGTGTEAAPDMQGDVLRLPVSCDPDLPPPPSHSPSEAAPISA